MIVNRFPYQKLSRKTIEGSRKYFCPDGSALASVTTILDKTKPEVQKKSLEEWRKRVGHEKAKQITKHACTRGTSVHKFLETFILEDSAGQPDDNPAAIESFNMAQHIIKNGLSNVKEFYGAEVGLYYENAYAGTTDCVGMYKDKLSIIDFKQTNTPKKAAWVEDYKLQLCAYIWAHNQRFNTEIRNGIIMMCDPKMQYQQFEVDETTFDHYSNLWWNRVAEYYQLFPEVANGAI